jgi:predicted ATP-dependent endonuclease of OLD family
MFKISEVNIEGFWHRIDAGCRFNDDVNIIVGRNGSGKTTFMNILHAVLAVDMDGLSSNGFDAVAITLSDGDKTRTIRAKKVDDERVAFAIVEYQISQKKYQIRVVTSDDRRMAMHYRRRALEESAEVREELNKLISLSSLSVYRLRSGDEYEVHDRHGTRIMSTVDLRLTELLQGLTHYQLELSQEAREIASTLQKDVLASILYGEDDAKEPAYALDFDKVEEMNRLTAAYTQLNAIDSGIRKKIEFHVTSIDSAIKDLTRARE